MATMTCPIPKDSFMDCSTQTTEEIRVPRDFPTLEAAVHFANSELNKHSGLTLCILIEPNHVCEVEESIVVDFRGEQSQLIIDVQSEALHHQAQLIMDTPTPNRSLLRLVRGNLTVRNVRLEHCSPVDITVLSRTKSCNAAIVADPADTKNYSLNLQHLTITSYTGRGIINRCANPHLMQMEDVFVAKMWQ